jgi:DNA-binding CsgD family transcriptional regulator
MLDAIRRTHLERRYLDPELAALATGLGLRHTVTARQPLSRREYQVLQLISDGLENQAIAKSLFVSVETIRTHVKSILRKLHARDRAHAVAVAFRLGVLVAHRETPANDVPTARAANGENGDRPLPHLPHGQVAHGPMRPALAGRRALY